MNWKRFHLVLCMLLLAACATARGEKTRVLIVDGFSNHDWQRTTACLRMLLEKEGSYSVDVSTFPARTPEAEREAWKPDFKSYDVVIQNTNGGTNGPEWGAGAKKPWSSTSRTEAACWPFTPPTTPSPGGRNTTA